MIECCLRRPDSNRANRCRAWLISLCVIGGVLFGSDVRSEPSELKGSRYTLEIEPFAEHAGQNAIDLTHAGDGSGRVFVSTQSGQVYAFGPDGRSLGVFLDIASVRDDFVRSDGAFQGLMYVAFHPDYAEPDARGTGRFYTGHQVRVDDTTPAYDSKDHGARGDSNVRFVVAEWRVDADNPDRIDPASYRRVLLINFHTTGSNPHAMGELAFNPFAEPGDADYGNLYIAIGDSNNRNDSGDTDLRYAQRVDNPFAKMLRIDPLADGDRPYTIPDDNPFDNEVFALGLRNAQSYSFAKDLDDEPVLIAFDMGAALVEEINLVRLGSNYGWDRFEGTRDYDAARELHSPARPPAAQYAHTFPTRVGEDPTGGPAAIIGGLVVSDPDEPLMRGQVLFADLPRGTFMHASLHEMLDNENAGRQAPIYIMQARWGEKRGTFADLVGADRGDVRFGVGEDATVYLVSKQTQTIFRTRLVYTGEPHAIPAGALARTDTGGAPWPLILGLGGAVACIAIVLLVMASKGPKRSA